MITARHDFASDNAAGACPEAMTALLEANSGYTSGYATDTVTLRAADAVRRFLDADVDVRFVASGTAANAIACAALCRPFEAMLAHRHAHICTDETGAPGYFGQGLGLIGLAGASGKIDPKGLSDALAKPDVSFHQSPAALSITNATEYGAVYGQRELEALVGQAKAKGLGVHLDGARLANAVAAGYDVRSLKGSGVDILVLGGTKAGAPVSEAVVLFNKGLSRRFDARLKQAGQLVSKARFLSAPWIGLLGDGAMIRHAQHANAMAKKLSLGMPFALAHPVDANGVFISLDDARLQALNATGWFVHRFTDGSVRFMCSWASTEAAVEEVLACLRAIA